MDAALAFFRLEVSFEAQVASLAAYVEHLEAALAAYTTETKVSLSSDGARFIIAFLTDVAPLEKDGMEALAAETAAAFQAGQAGEEGTTE